MHNDANNTLHPGVDGISWDWDKTTDCAQEKKLSNFRPQAQSSRSTGLVSRSDDADLGLLLLIRAKAASIGIRINLTQTS